MKNIPLWDIFYLYIDFVSDEEPVGKKQADAPFRALHSEKGHRAKANMGIIQSDEPPPDKIVNTIK